MNPTIGVMGSSGGDLSETARGKAYRLGEAIAQRITNDLGWPAVVPGYRDRATVD